MGQAAKVMGAISLLFLITLPVFGQNPVLRQEPWADPAMTSRAGLVLWLDASRIEEANQTQKGSVKKGEKIAAWPDGSGNRLSPVQPIAAAQPRLVKIPGGTLVRFDGEDDHLRLTGQNRKLDQFTLAIVAVPHENAGNFVGFFALNGKNQRDYESGLTLDMGPFFTADFSQINGEGRGFGGARNLLSKGAPLGTLHSLILVGNRQAKTVDLFVDGVKTGSRPWTGGPISAEEMTVGARYYTNGPGAQEVRGPLQGDLAEALLYDRPLDRAGIEELSGYFKKKYETMARGLPVNLGLKSKGEALVTVSPPPAVQMLLPGFEVRQLPLDLPNINNLKYRADGKLVALSYGGDVWLLTDTNGDGLEDKATPWFVNKGRLRSPIGMAWTPKGHPLGDGLVVASKGKVSFLSDTNGDGLAEEKVIASGWKESSAGVDALGVTIDPKDGSIYFGLGVWDYTNAFQTNAEGKSDYRLDSERGTILRISADLKKREIVCTGIRFPVGLEFNGLGDLFCTEQEGATWLANGNPFDELLHIQKGRHYGFPPRHPVHLPQVNDEPSVYDYGPQHQSTCGLTFNRDGRGFKKFGPAHWIHDALVAGESRGKIYRTKLVKTPAGYIAQNQIIACLPMLTIDQAVTPTGDLVVCVHSGAPDWGTGPTGKGKLYKIAYVDRKTPQPVAIWPTGPRQVQIAFDRAIPEASLGELSKEISLVHGAHVRAGDRFETIRPGYDVVRRQMASSRKKLAVYGLQITPDRHSLLLNTDAHNASDFYALTLPGIGRPPLGKIDAPAGSVLGQYPQIDLDYTLAGVEARWTAADAKSSWTGWVPHLDLGVTRTLVRGSQPHEELWSRMGSGGTLELKTQLLLKDMLRPTVQPGSKLDHSFPPEKLQLTFTSRSPFSGTVAGKALSVTAISGKSVAKIDLDNPKDPQLLALKIDCAEVDPVVSVTWSTAEDPRERAMPLHRFLLPWAPKPGLEPLETPRELVKGNWSEGRKVFFGEQANCSKCHALHGQGSTIAPDLSNLIHRDVESVTRDITFPSHAIHPDYLSYLVTLKSGRVLTGTLRRETGKTLISDKEGTVHRFDAADIESAISSPKSIMPEGIPALLGPEKLENLIAFLLNPPPSMPLEGLKIPYPARMRAEVEAVLAGAPPAEKNPKPLNLVLVAGPKDHGPGEHHYPAWQKAWAPLMAAGANTTVETAWEWPSDSQWKNADAVVLFQYGDWNDKRAKAVDSFLERGGGLVIIHWAVAGRGAAQAQAFAERIGLASNIIKFRHGPIDLNFGPGKDHPICRNVGKVHFHDESYWQMTGDIKRLKTLATGMEDGEAQPLFWVREQGRGRVFVSIPGHYNWTFDDPLFRVLLLRGIAWSAGQPVDRFNDLVWPGARLRD